MPEQAQVSWLIVLQGVRAVGFSLSADHAVLKAVRGLSRVTDGVAASEVVGAAATAGGEAVVGAVGAGAGLGLASALVGRTMALTGDRHGD